MTETSNIELSKVARKVLEMTILYPHLSYKNALIREHWVRNDRPDYNTRKKGEKELVDKGILQQVNGELRLTPQAYDVWSPEETKKLLSKTSGNFAGYAKLSRDEASKMREELYKLENSVRALKNG